MSSSSKDESLFQVLKCFDFILLNCQLWPHLKRQLAFVCWPRGRVWVTANCSVKKKKKFQSSPLICWKSEDKSKFQLKWPKNQICFSALDGEGGQKPQDYTSNELTKQIRKILDSRSSSSTGILWNCWHTGVCCRGQLEWPRWTCFFFFFLSLAIYKLDDQAVSSSTSTSAHFLKCWKNANVFF